jgi:hypothetical protein
MPTLYEKIEQLFDDGKLDTTYPPSVYEAYLKAQGLSLGELKTYPMLIADKIAGYYVGYYETRRDFIDVYITDICGVQIPSTLTVDYNTTWEADLRHSYEYVPGDNEAAGEGWYFQRH